MKQYTKPEVDVKSINAEALICLDVSSMLDFSSNGGGFDWGN